MNIPDDLIILERAAEQERQALHGLDGEQYEQQWRRWREAADALQAAVTKHAEAEGASRYDVEMAVKKAVRHGEPDGA